ncbi:hypothetical protein F0562_030665 [Nyssa sinensis]|uniref:Uncharacterized protein n=1 Tax=Nyssa sinensis TaxID=561372 RepID=A0A5J5B1B1_9ASTE|nr:hypothetical protein F0562_030665 [Nyssa sinensis]
MHKFIIFIFVHLISKLSGVRFVLKAEAFSSASAHIIFCPQVRLFWLFQSHKNKINCDFHFVNHTRIRHGGVCCHSVFSHSTPLVATDLVGAEKHLEEIRTFLKDDKITRIGVWGMGGVGKTAIVTHIHNWLQENPSCADRVYWVTVSQDSSIQKLQNDIAKCINLDLSKEDDQKKRAAMLSNALKQRKKFVIILDDMWIEFSLEEMGIPIEEGQMISGKLLITCRSLEVCHKMKCQKQIKVEPLPTKEAWALFMKEAGWEPDSDQKIVKAGDYTVEIDTNIVHVAKCIAEECAGLPLAISTSAKSMTGGDGIRSWENALHELRESISGSIDMEGRVFKVLKSSYERLKNTTFQQCFLYCAFFPEDYNIPKVELIVHWIAEGLLDDRKTWKQKYDLGHSILKRLENVCLLESGQDNNNGICVKMHDVIRDMALNIAKENDHGVFKVKSGPRLLNPNANELEWSQHLERVCLHEDVMEDHLSCTITTSPQCPKLVTLMLQFNQNVPEIPDHFFAQMGSLRVLDLSYMTLLKRLPNSISSLTTLRGLLLDSCLNLEYVPSLAELKELRGLILSRSVVAKVPVGLEGLVKLECLDLSASSRITSIPPNLIRKLSQLQCLRLDYVNVDIPVDQLSSSRQLEMLSMHFYDLQKFNSYVKTRHPEGLCQYHLQIRSRPQSKNLSIGSSLERKQVSVISSRIEKGDLGIVLPTNMQELSIFECKLPNSLLDFSPSLNNIAFKNLERCQIGNSTGINYLWSFTKTTISVPTQLQILKLDNLEELTRLFNYESEGIKLGSAQASPSPSPSPVVTSSALKLLIVSKCPKLEYLFTAWLVAALLPKPSTHSC